MLYTLYKMISCFSVGNEVQLGVSSFDIATIRCTTISVIDNDVSDGSRSSQLTLTEAPGGTVPVEVYPSSCLLYTSPSPRDATLSRMPSSA